MTIISIAFVFSLFLLGTIVGSFFNVVACRYPSTSSGQVPSTSSGRVPFWSGRSHCPRCKKTLRWHELTPVFSFIIQLGRCRGCGGKISWQYPIIEIATGFAFLLPLYFYQNAISIGIVWLLIASAMILLSAIDWREMIIPDGLNLFLAVLGLVLAFWGSESFLKNYTEWLIPGPTAGFTRHLVGAITGLIILGFIFLLSKGKAMGLGDVKLAGAMGLILGWPDIILALALGFLIGGIWGLSLLIFGRGRLKTLVPFGPFLVIGFWLHVFFGYQLLGWYFSLV